MDPITIPEDGLEGQDRPLCIEVATGQKQLRLTVQDHCVDIASGRIGPTNKDQLWFRPDTARELIDALKVAADEIGTP